MATNIPDTTLVQTQIRSKDNPDEYFAVTLQNTYYRIRVDTGLQYSVLFENDIDDYIDNLKAVKLTIQQFKDII